MAVVIICGVHHGEASDPDTIKFVVKGKKVEVEAGGAATKTD